MSVRPVLAIGITRKRKLSTIHEGDVLATQGRSGWRGMFLGGESRARPWYIQGRAL